MHLVVTDSGLGGLTVCAQIERRLREHGGCAVRLTYVNARPEEGLGYNDLPDIREKARVFDRVLRRIAGMEPDRVLIACNTLSIVFDHTDFSGAPPVPVQGIVGAGVDLFVEALSARPASAVLLLGTRTTIESAVHRERLLARGIAASRVGGASCHGLAAAIEQDPASAAVASLIDTCAERGGDAAPVGEPLYLGLCCTHYAMVAGRLEAAVARVTGRTVTALDPNTRLVRDTMPELLREAGGGTSPSVQVRVVSKVTLADDQRKKVAALLDPVSRLTADALRAYSHVPDLF